MIDKLIPDDAGEWKYLDGNGCSYRSKSEYLQTEVLGFCGCGNPDEVMKYVYNLLITIKNGESGSYEDMPYMFFVYWANENNFLEHGTTARCSWLTDLGHELLSDIEWCLKNETND
jgi:hypothetical protein